jgi:acetyl esterase/lipase
MLGILIAATATSLLAAPPGLPSPVPEVAAEFSAVDRYPATEVDFAGGVRGLPHLVFAEPPGHRPLELDLYLPPVSLHAPATGLPLVVFIHGGGWSSGDTRRIRSFVDFPGVLASLSARGYVVASIEYRLSGEARFPAQAADVSAAIRWLRGNAFRYGIDPARALAWGVSAGGHLAALAAVNCNALVTGPKPSTQTDRAGVATDVAAGEAATDCLQGAVAWYGVYDMATIAEQVRQVHGVSRDADDAPEWKLLGCSGRRGCTTQQLAAASPVTYVDHADPPILLIAGSTDTVVPTQQTLEMAARLDAAGVNHELMVLPGVSHNFIGPTFRQTREANLEALAATFSFIDRTIGSASAASAARDDQSRDDKE